MSRLTLLGTYLPPWGTDQSRIAGLDEDAVTLAVAAARAALRDGTPGEIHRVVFITRDLPLLEGGNGAVLLAGIGLPSGTGIVEQVGGAPAVLDAIACAERGTLIVTADQQPAGAAAALVGDTGPEVRLVARIVRSLPVRTRDRDGSVHVYDDPRLERRRGAGVSVERLGLPAKPVAVAGLPAKDAAGLCQGTPPGLPTLGASAALFALAALDGLGGSGLVLAIEQAAAAAVTVDGTPAVHREERSAQPPPELRHTPGSEIAISLPAYERAFESKLHWTASRCAACGTLALPPRFRCLGCGVEGNWSSAALPRGGEVYTTVTVHVPVPGLPTPYSLAIVQLDDVDVRALVHVTGAPPGTVRIGDRGALVLRRVAVRTGVLDYGYALLPDEPQTAVTKGDRR